MAKMALRVYTREIEELIEHGQIKESIAHARHILSSFPKYVDAYRLLGKAYLEEQLYGDAADIFQRVLSAKPDDFISNVGMSIIREDEGNLDAAIWHMERAFEVQPSNKAIQDELRRLFGRRDGMQPPKIRLTRGALARMYAHGDLYDQAIAEIHSALAEDPQRHDLQILLAKMYYKSGDRAKAIETCNLILGTLPFCLEANYILSKIYQKTGQEDEAEYYRNTVASLDPYSAMTTKTAPLSENVAANTVTIEHLEWHPGMMTDLGTEAAWSAKLGLSGKKKDAVDEEKPSWLTDANEDGEETGASESPFLTPEENVEDEVQEDAPAEDEVQEDAPAEDELPEWMRSAVNKGEAGEEPAQPEAEEIPDWLKNGETTPEAGEPEMMESQGVPDMPMRSAESQVVEMEGGGSADEPSGPEGLPDFLQQAGWEEGNEESEEISMPAEAEQPEETEEIAAAEIPDWMQDMKPESADAEAGAIDLEGLSTEMEDFEWPEDEGDTEGGEQPQAMGWMGEAAEDESGGEAAAEAEEMPSWMQGLEQAGADETDEDETPSWLQDLAGGGESPDTETPLEAAEAELDLPMDPAEAGIDEQAAAAAEGEAADLSWLAQDTPSEDAGSEEEASSEIEGDAPDLSWLAQDTPSEDVDEIKEAPVVIEGDAPDFSWLKQEVEAAEIEAGGEASDPLEEAGPEFERAAEESEAEPAEDEMVEPEPAEAGAMEWMAGLAAESPQVEDSEAQDEDTPEWMQGMVTGEAPFEEDDSASMEMEPQPGAEDSEAQADPMSWLDEIGSEGSSDEPAAPPPGVADEGGTPPWMDEISAQHEQLSEELLESSEGETMPQGEEGPDSEYVLGIDDQSMSWLEGLAAKQGAPEEELFSEPDNRAQEMPEWLQEIDEASDEVPPTPDTPVQESAQGEPADLADEPPSEATADEGLEGADEMSWVEELSEDSLADEGYGLRKGGDTSQLIRSLVFDEEGQPKKSADVRPDDEIRAQEGTPGSEAPSVENDSGWKIAGDDEPDVQNPPEPVPTAPRVRVTGELDFENVYQKGLSLLQDGDLENAVKSFGDLIKRGYFLDEIIQALQESVVRFPIEISLYQTMGDAYMRADRLQDALDSYSKAEDLLR